MIGQLTNHVWQSTLFAVAAGLLTVAFRKNRAQVRYWVWFSASFKFFIPFSLLTSLGSGLQWAPAARKIATPAVSFAIEQVTQPFPETVSFAPSTAGTRDWVLIALLGVWACGFAAIALIRFRGWLRIRAAVRSSKLLFDRTQRHAQAVGSFDIPATVEVRSCLRSAAGLLEPGVVGWFRPMLLLPAGIAERLTPRQLEAVLAHELCHVRRHDNLTSAIHMIVEAIFWFHPLVWWIGAWLVEERERACDEEVLSLGGEPRVYAEAILNVCKLYVESPLVCVSGVTGSNLKKRIEAIMTNRIVLRLNFAKKVALASTGMAALVVPIVVGMMNAPPIRAQSAAAATAAFEVASVRSSDRNAGAGDVGGFKSQDGKARGTAFQVEHRRLTATNFNLFGLIVKAYGLVGCRPLGGGNCILLSGGPDWLRKDGFDILAKIPDDSPDYTLSQLQKGQAPQLQLMLQALLADRFHLKLHREKKQVAVFALTIGKKGPKFKKADEAEQPMLIFRPSVQSNGQKIIQLVVKNSSMQELADMYSMVMDRPVLDRTGLNGKFDFTMDYEANADAPGPFTELTGPGLFTAFQEQAGLKLEATKGSVEVLVIDHAEHPSEN